MTQRRANAATNLEHLAREGLPARLNNARGEERAGGDRGLDETGTPSAPHARGGGSWGMSEEVASLGCAPRARGRLELCLRARGS